MRNFTLYEELMRNYKVFIASSIPRDMSAWPVVLLRLPPTLDGDSRFKVIKNSAELTTLELAIICAEGAECIAYKVTGASYYRYVGNELIVRTENMYKS